MLTTVHHSEPIFASKCMKNPKNSKKKIKKNIFLKKAGKSIPRPRAGMDFPALYPFNLTNFWKILTLLGFSCTLMPK